MSSNDRFFGGNGYDASARSKHRRVAQKRAQREEEARMSRVKSGMTIALKGEGSQAWGNGQFFCSNHGQGRGVSWSHQRHSDWKLYYKGTRLRNGDQVFLKGNHGWLCSNMAQHGMMSLSLGTEDTTNCPHWVSNPTMKCNKLYDFPKFYEQNVEYNKMTETLEAHCPTSCKDSASASMPSSQHCQPRFPDMAWNLHWRGLGTLKNGMTVFLEGSDNKLYLESTAAEGAGVTWAQSQNVQATFKIYADIDSVV